MIENTFGINIIPNNEVERLNALKRYQIVDTPSEESFDDVAKLAARIFNVPISLLSLVDTEKVFFKANIGMGTATEANRGKSLCALAILDTDVTVFEDALKEPCLMANPNVVGNFGLRFYAGAPLVTSDGYAIGTLCIIDKIPRDFTDHEKAVLAGLAKLAMNQIELRLSALETISEQQLLNKKLVAVQEELKLSIEELAATNEELESTNEELNVANEDLNKSYELTVQLNKNLTKSELRFKSFIRKAPVAIGILNGKNLTIEVANDMILKIWGKTKAVIGLPLQTALPELEGQPFLSILDNVYTSGKTYTGQDATVKIDFNGEIKDGYFDFIYEPLIGEDGLPNAIIVIANDVTERIEARQEQEKLMQQLEVALNAGKLGAYNLELETGLMSCSKQCKQNFGLTEADMFNFENLISAIVPEYRLSMQQKVEGAIKNNSVYEAEYMITLPDGDSRWISASGLPRYDMDGKATNMIGVTVDITNRKNFERQKDDFLSIASHELKTPITSLKASLQLLERLKDDLNHNMVPRLIDQAGKSMDKIDTLVNDLLNINRISEGQLSLDKTTFTIADMLQNCCNHVRVTGRHEIIVSGDERLQINADEHRIDQVVVNFVNNAVKYAPNAKQIFIIVEKLEREAKITVRDTGEGIPKELLPYLFDRYYRADYKGKTYSGLGLGLYISAEIIKRHGGNIGVDSVVGEGSSFWFTIPLN